MPKGSAANYPAAHFPRAPDKYSALFGRLCRGILRISIAPTTHTCSTMIAGSLKVEALGPLLGLVRGGDASGGRTVLVLRGQAEGRALGFAAAPVAAAAAAAGGSSSAAALSGGAQAVGTAGQGNCCSEWGGGGATAESCTHSGKTC